MPSQKQSVHIPSDAVLCDVATDKKAAKSLENVKAKYPHVLPVNIWRLGKHLMVVIRCQHDACEAHRLVATSDAFQVKTCIEHKGGVAKGVPERAPKGARSNRGTKSGRKAPKATRGNRKAPTAPRKGRGLAKAIAEITAR